MDDLTIRGVETPDTGGARAGGRRDFLKKVGIGAAAAWTAPIVLSTTAAQAQGTVTGIAFVGAATSSATSTSALVIANPAGQAGDRLLAIVATDTATTDPLGASGWNQLITVPAGGTGTNTVRTFLLERIAPGTGGTFSFTRTGSDGTIFRGAIVAYSGVASVGTPTTAADATPVASHGFPAVTTSGPSNQWIVRLGALGSSVRDWDAPAAGYNSRHDSGSTDRAITVFDSPQSTPGTQAAVTLGNTGGNTRAGLHSIALLPS